MRDPFDFSWMNGRKVEFSFSEPATWFVTFGDSLTISVCCPWRLIRHGGIAVSSDDHLQKFGLPAPIDAAERATSLLADSTVERVELREGTADLFVYFQDDCRLEIIPLSSGYESWQVSTPSGKRVIAQGGGQLSAW